MVLHMKKIKKKFKRAINTNSWEILCGIHPVLEALKAQKRTFFKLFVSEERSRTRVNSIIELAQRRNIDVISVPNERLDEMSSGVKHQGIAAEVTHYPVQKAEYLLRKHGLKVFNKERIHDKERWHNKENYHNGEITHNDDYHNKFFVILEGVDDPHNLGAIIRTALCSGVDHIVLPKDRSVHPSPSVSRASAGAMEHADISIVTNITFFIKELKKKGVWVAGLDAQGETSLFKADLSGSIALVVGGEHSGIRPLVKKECDFLISLPMVKGVTSLNASVACGIAMYEVFRQRSV